MADILGAEVDEEGFLVNLKDWTAEIAIVMAKGDDINLADDDAELYHERWEVLIFYVITLKSTKLLQQYEY